MLIQVRKRFLERSGPVDLETISATYELANCYRVLGDLKEAESLSGQVFDLRRIGLGIDHPDTLKMMDLLGLVRMVAGEYKTAEEVLGECLEIREKASPDSWSRFHTESLLGGCLMGQKKYLEAETHLLSAFRGMKQREKTMAPSDQAFRIRVRRTTRPTLRRLGKERQGR